MLRKLARLWALFLLVLIASQAQAQLLPTPKAEESKTTGTDTATATPAPAAAPPTDPLGRETPRDAVSGLLAALAERDYPLAANYFEARSN
ncbi:mechanosensitive ion channel family protein MscS, partial [Sphingomonas sp. LH128]